MEPIKDQFELELQVEELEGRIAPDGGETVVPLPTCNGNGNGHGH
jgi:hypothetical protein